MERFDCPVCDWAMQSRYYLSRQYVELFCLHCHVACRMHFDRNDPKGWPVAARKELERVRERLWGSASASFDQSTLEPLLTQGVQG